MISDQNAMRERVYEALCERKCKNKKPRFTEKETMLFMDETHTSSTNMRPLQRQIKEKIGYSLFQSKAVIDRLRKQADLQSAEVIKLELEAVGTTEKKVILKKVPVFYIKQISEAYSLSILENVNGKKFNIPDGVSDEYITLHYGGDLGKGHTQCSISTVTRDHNNSSKNSVVVALWENADTYRNLSKIFKLFGREQFSAIASRPMINFIVTNQQSTPSVHISMMVLNVFGSNHLRGTLATDRGHQEWLRSAPLPHDDMLSRMKHEFLKKTPQAHYSVNQDLFVLSSEWLYTDLLGPRVTDWRKYCDFDPSGLERVLWLRGGAVDVIGEDFDGVVAVKHRGFIVCQLRVRTFVRNDGVKMSGRLWFFGGAMIYPFVDLRNLHSDRICYLQSKTDSFKLLKLQNIDDFPRDDEGSKICWFSKPGQFKVCGDLNFLSKIFGHGGQGCTFPCFMCTATLEMIKSSENATNAEHGKWKYRTNSSALTNFTKTECVGAKLADTDGIKYLPLLPLFPWIIEPSGFHIFEGLMAKLQGAQMFFLENQTALSAEQKCVVKKIDDLKIDQRKIVHSLADRGSFEQVLKIKEYGTEDIECDLDHLQPRSVKEADDIQRKIDELYLKITPNTALRKIIDWQNDHKLIQHDYRPNSVKGAVLKANIKHYVELADIIRTEFDCLNGTQLGDDWESIMADYKTLHGYICKVGPRLSEEQMIDLEQCLARFGLKYYSFIDTYGKPATREGTINGGIKIHSLKHIMDCMRCNGNTRLAFTNEERIEAMIQFLYRIIAPYKHFFGERRLWNITRQSNVKTLPNVFFEDNWIVRVPEEEQIGDQQNGD